MNETTQTDLELQIVELGDAKELTMGQPALINTEENSQSPYKIV